MRKIISFLAAFAIVFCSIQGCNKPSEEQNDPIEEEQQQKEDDDQGGGQDDDQGGQGQGGNEEEQGGQDDDQGGGQGQGQGGNEEEQRPQIVVIDKGASEDATAPTPSHPELSHSVTVSEFYDNYYDWLDDFGNIDYVLSQGYGTAWPAITGNGHILLYQARGSKGGNYMRVRSAYGATLTRVSLSSATRSKIAYSVNGRPSTMSKTSDIEAGGVFTPELPAGCTEVCFFCMGSDQSERLEVSSVSVDYKGGFIEEDFFTAPVEAGPLIRVTLPYKEDFEDESFPTTEKNTYEKYGLTAGPENACWKTWYGCFSWQHPKNVTTFGGKSPQLRVYQEDPDYEKSQWGYLKTEFFIENLKQISFDWYMSEFWMCATVSWCEFGETEWRNAAELSLENYSDRQTVRHTSYVLDGGKPHNAKIKIEIDPATGHPGRDHYDLILDNFVFE